MMPGQVPNSDHRDWSRVAGLLAIVPLLVSFVTGLSSRETPPLTRSGTLKRPLQFARYCFNHGRDPVTHTSTLTSRFQFRNVGAETIQLGEIERSCGCLTPELSHSWLEPGEIGEMKVSVPLADQSAGFHEFQLTVHYTAPKPCHETVLIKAVFPERKIHVTPRALDISQTGQVDRSVTHHFTITDHRSPPLNVETVESSSPWIHGSILSVEDDGRVTRIAMEIQGDMPAGIHRMLVHALTDDPLFPAAVMPIRIKGPERREPVVVLPSRVHVLPNETTAQAVEMHVPSDWQISHVDCFPSELLCEWESTAARLTKKQQRVTLALMMSAPPASQTREGVVTLYANDSTEMVTMSVRILDVRHQSADNVVAVPRDTEHRSN